MITIRVVPSISDAGVKATFDGERVSYNGDSLSPEAVLLEYTAHDGYGVLFSDDDFSANGEIKKGTKVSFPHGKPAKVTEVRNRVSVTEGGWDTPGQTVVCSEIKLAQGQWISAAGAIPVSVWRALRKYRRNRAEKYIRAKVRARVRNNFKSSKEEIISYFNHPWADGDLPAKEALKIALKELERE